MKPVEIVFLVLVIVVLLITIISAIYRKKKGKSSCGSDCSSCGGGCAKCSSNCPGSQEVDEKLKKLREERLKEKNKQSE